MRYLFCLMLAACSATEVVATDEACKNITRESYAAVPYEWAVFDDTNTYVMDDGCIFTDITHYILEDDYKNNNPYNYGSGLPPGYWERGCGWDGCDPFEKQLNPELGRPVEN